MPGEPTYENLVKRVKQLEQKVFESQYINEELQTSKGILNAVVDSLPFDIFVLDLNNRYLLQNSICKNNWGDLIGKCPEDLPVNEETLNLWLNNNLRALSGETVADEVEYHSLEGKKYVYYNIIAPIRVEEKISGILGVLIDISNLKQVEQALYKAKNELERRVKKRTGELEIKTKILEELNTAMKVLLRKREEDKKELEDNVLTNLKQMIEPYFDKLKKTKLDDQQRALLSIMESNLRDITSPFTRKMSFKYSNLTSKENQIANLIRHGNTTKKIAKLMNLSPRTIDTHRKNIRRKIGLQGQRGNLRSHLLSLR